MNSQTTHIEAQLRKNPEQQAAPATATVDRPRPLTPAEVLAVAGGPSIMNN